MRKPKNIPDAITLLRKTLDLSKEKFAAKVGCSFQTVLKWESGSAEVSMEKLLRLWEMSREIAPLCADVFANEMPVLRRLLQEKRALEAYRAELLKALKEEQPEIATETLKSRPQKEAWQAWLEAFRKEWEIYAEGHAKELDNALRVRSKGERGTKDALLELVKLWVVRAANDALEMRSKDTSDVSDQHPRDVLLFLKAFSGIEQSFSKREL
jgi:transcriptional regulator with XRE-family HTH domain